MDKKDIVEQIKVPRKWIRGLFMLIFLAVFGVIKAIGLAAVVFQFLHVLITGATNQPLRSFSAHLVTYVAQVYSYLLYLTDEKPFPFRDWPGK